MDIILIFNKDKESFNLSKKDASNIPFFAILHYFFIKNCHFHPYFLSYFILFQEIITNTSSSLQRKIISRKQHFQVFSMENEEH